ncbi:MAG: hypothetical protein ACLQVK_20240 [Acidimicrobiales bacterium]|jgi:hypothetical protein
MMSNCSSRGRRYRVASLLATSVAIGTVLGTVVDAQAAPRATQAGNACAATCTFTFNYTGRPQTFTVPDGVTSVTALVYGAFGGPVCVAKSTALPFTPGGSGGAIAGTLRVTAGEQLTVMVGGAGKAGPSSDCAASEYSVNTPALPGYRAAGDGAGGFGGGGAAGPNPGPGSYGAGGGGASFLLGPGHRVQLVGAGGGGASGITTLALLGGNGATALEPSTRVNCGSTCFPDGGNGGPATPSSPGAGGKRGHNNGCPGLPPGTAGSSGSGPATGSGWTGGQGATWGKGANPSCQGGQIFTGGGGGGGYFGGGGGGCGYGGCGTGSGGSSYGAPDIIWRAGPTGALRGALLPLSLVAADGNGRVVLVTHR